MFSVDEATAAIVRQVYEASGELSAVVELRRHFPGITNNDTARLCDQDDRELETVASPAPEASSDMSDQIIDALMACAIQADAARTHPLVEWIVMRDQPDHPDERIARLVIEPKRPRLSVQAYA
jgi:hypothetical protein